MAPASSVVLTREQLYERIWAGPTTKLAKELGVSDVAVGKACKRHNIPKPPLGYWAKKAHGKAPRRPPLPACTDHHLEKVYFTPSPLKLLEPDPLAERPIQTPEIQKIVADLEAREMNWQVPTMPKRILPVVKATQNGLRAASRRARNSYARPTDQLIYPESDALFASVNVAPESIDRALAFLNALLEILETIGFAFVPSKDTYHQRLVVELFGIRHILVLSETTKRHPHQATDAEIRRAKESSLFKLPKYAYLRTGRLRIGVNEERWSIHKTLWVDHGESTIESKLQAIVYGLLLLIDKDLADQRRREEERARQIEEARRAAEAEKQRQIEEKRVDLFIKEIERWELARRMRRYIRAAEINALQRVGSFDPQSEFGLAIAWAKDLADRTDPQSPKGE